VWICSSAAGRTDFAEQAGNGSIVAADSRTGAGLSRIKTKHPEWFSDSGIEAKVSGEAFYDPELRWTGTCMSSFGMVFNRDVETLGRGTRNPRNGAI